MVDESDKRIKVNVLNTDKWLHIGRIESCHRSVSGNFTTKTIYQTYNGMKII